MRFLPTAVDGAFAVEITPHEDERGLFARTFCAATFAERGLDPRLSQCSVSVSRQRGTLRGLHYQAEPAAEAKLVRATRGRVFDVAVDLRPGSPTFLKWAGLELDARLHNALYVPEGCAHGFLTLEENCELLYQISTAYAPALSRCLRWDDPAFGIEWPFAPSVMNERDASAPDYRQ